MCGRYVTILTAEIRNVESKVSCILKFRSLKYIHSSSLELNILYLSMRSELLSQMTVLILFFLFLSFFIQAWI